MEFALRPEDWLNTSAHFIDPVTTSARHILPLVSFRTYWFFQDSMLSFLFWALHLCMLLVLPFSFFYFFPSYGFYLISASQVELVVKNPPANTGYIPHVAVVI